MMPKSSQLILEVLLLKERYSTKDIAQAKRIMDEKFKNFDLSELLDVIVSDSAPSRQMPKNNNSNPRKSRDALKKSFLENLRRTGNINNRRYKILADTLGVKWEEGKQEQFLRVVSGQLDAMSDEELRDFLEVKKTTSAPDENYVNLANYLVEKDTGYKN